MCKIPVLVLIFVGGSMTLNLVFEWKDLDLKFSSAAIRQMMITDGSFIPENNVPSWMQVHQDKLFVTIPRRREGVPVSLAFVDLKDKSTKSPKFIPYPTWGAHYKYSHNEPLISDAESIRADRCDRLWVLDNGTNPTLLIFDLCTDKIIRRYPIPTNQVYAYLTVMAVDDSNCENTYVYITEKYEPNRIVVYSWAKNDSWLIVWDKGIEDLVVASNSNLSTLYINTKGTYELFSISTEYLRNESIATQSTEAFELHGILGSESRLGNVVYDPDTRVLFYLKGNGTNVEHGHYEVACWNTDKEFHVNTSRSIQMKDHSIFPLKISKLMTISCGSYRSVCPGHGQKQRMSTLGCFQLLLWKLSTILFAIHLLKRKFLRCNTMTF